MNQAFLDTLRSLKEESLGLKNREVETKPAIDAVGKLKTDNGLHQEKVGGFLRENGLAETFTLAEALCWAAEKAIG
jgi:hypothetical protein